MGGKSSKQNAKTPKEEENLEKNNIDYVKKQQEEEEKKAREEEEKKKNGNFYTIDNTIKLSKKLINDFDKEEDEEMEVSNTTIELARDAVRNHVRELTRRQNEKKLKPVVTIKKEELTEIEEEIKEISKNRKIVEEKSEKIQKKNEEYLDNLKKDLIRIDEKIKSKKTVSSNDEHYNNTQHILKTKKEKVIQCLNENQNNPIVCTTYINDYHDYIMESHLNKE
eukprot:TRINITY_DN3426_c0_g1_i1.p1 TRINITY_DN3426_c0_g1~~TRINITY_DN3426_c0_g1_i1.p1  ORF type:complete len:223 (+),score=89.26 TRINITY_DN3426_c0_g1_i1:32-700(+)